MAKEKGFGLLSAFNKEAKKHAKVFIDVGKQMYKDYNHTLEYEADQKAKAKKKAEAKKKKEKKKWRNKNVHKMRGVGTELKDD